MGEYKFKELILLVGTNPLPNFVVADYFLKNNPYLEKIWLIHSKKNEYQKSSYNQALQLEILLQKNWKNEHKALKFPLEKIALSDVSNAHKIKSTMQETFPENFDQFHFNYTGGTKSMSIHVYDYLKNLSICEDKSFSYLDARNFRLMDDEKGVIVDKLQEKIKLDFDGLIKLHGFERCNSNKENIFNAMIDKMAEIIENDDLGKVFNNQDGYYRSLFYNNKYQLSKKPSELDEEKVNQFTPNNTFLAVIQSMPEEYQLFTTDKKFNWNISQKKFSKPLKYIDGFWLEDYLIKSFDKHIDPHKVKMYSNWEIRKPEWEKISSELYFELDILFMYGYQLTGVSVTTDSSKKLCKSKGFEIIQRTRQIGGDEARAVVVTFLDDVKKIQVQEELMYEMGTNEKRIKILGINDIKKKDLISIFNDYLFTE